MNNDLSIYKCIDACNFQICTQKSLFSMHNLFTFLGSLWLLTVILTSTNMLLNLIASLLKNDQCYDNVLHQVTIADTHHLILPSNWQQEKCKLASYVQQGVASSKRICIKMKWFSCSELVCYIKNKNIFMVVNQQKSKPHQHICFHHSNW